YGKASGSLSGSTYSTFLAALCYQLLGKPLPQPEKAIRFTQSRQREDGGFVEVSPMRRSGTNPTAAAIGVLQILGAEIPDSVADFLATTASPEGGLRANLRVPLADLLSTF